MGMWWLESVVVGTDLCRLLSPTIVVFASGFGKPVRFQSQFGCSFGNVVGVGVWRLESVVVGMVVFADCCCPQLRSGFENPVRIQSSFGFLHLEIYSGSESFVVGVCL